MSSSLVRYPAGVATDDGLCMYVISFVEQECVCMCMCRRIILTLNFKGVSFTSIHIASFPWRCIVYKR